MDLEALAKQKAEQLLKQKGVTVKCPNCNSSFTARSMTAVCPSCNKSFNVEFNVKNFG